MVHIGFLPSPLGGHGSSSPETFGEFQSTHNTRSYFLSLDPWPPPSNQKGPLKTAGSCRLSPLSCSDLPGAPIPQRSGATSQRNLLLQPCSGCPSDSLWQACWEASHTPRNSFSSPLIPRREALGGGNWGSREGRVGVCLQLPWGAGEDAVCALLAPWGTPFLPQSSLCQRWARARLATPWQVTKPPLCSSVPTGHSVIANGPGLQQGQDKVRILTSGGPARAVGDDPGVALLSLFLPPLCTSALGNLWHPRVPQPPSKVPPWLHPVLASQGQVHHFPADLTCLL